MEIQHWLTLIGILTTLLVFVVGWLIKAILGIRDEAQRNMTEHKTEVKERLKSHDRSIAVLRDEKASEGYVREYVDLAMKPVDVKLEHIREGIAGIQDMLRSQNGRSDG